MDLSGARDRAAEIGKAARLGANLIADEHMERQAHARLLTISQLIAEYHGDIESPNRKGGALRTAREIERRLRRALSTHLETPAHEIKRRDLSELLDPIAGAFPREAEKRRQVIETMFKWGVAKGYVQLNPAAGLLSYGSGELRNRVLNSEEIKRFWRWLDDGADNLSEDVIAILKLQLLTGARVGEVAGLEASEVWSRNGELFWTLPATRSKNKKSHTRPIVGQARSIVESVLRTRTEGPLFRILDESRAIRSDDVGLALNNRTRPIPHFTVRIRGGPPC